MIHKQDIIFAWLLGDLSEYIYIFVVSWRGNSPISFYLHMPPSEAFWAVPTNSKDTLEPHCFWALFKKKEGQGNMEKQTSRGLSNPATRMQPWGIFCCHSSTGHSPSTSVFPELPSILLLITHTCL